MTIKVKHEYGKVLYLKADPEQLEYFFVGLRCSPGQIKFILSHLGEEFEIFDFETSEEKDIMKLMAIENTEE